MIKCPNCGSTAQVELVWKTDYSYTDFQEYDYECKCGCSFTARFEVVSITVKEENNND